MEVVNPISCYDSTLCAANNCLIKPNCVNTGEILAFYIQNTYFRTTGFEHQN